MSRCIICYDEKECTIVCAEGHATCKECLGPFVASIAADLSKTDLIVSKADAAAACNDAAAVARLEGYCLCPLSGHGCNAGPFDDKDIAMHVSPDVFCAFVGSKVHLPTARKLQDVVAKKQELSLLLPNARQCRRCSYGPVELFACSDLTAHHGEGGIDNSCPRCGWFAPNISMWPRWDPTAAALTSGDPLDAVFSQAQESEAVAGREERRREAARFCEERRRGTAGLLATGRALARRRAARDERWGVTQQLPDGGRRWIAFGSRPPAARWLEELQAQELPAQRRRLDRDVFESGRPSVQLTLHGLASLAAEGGTVGPSSAGPSTDRGEP